jgi:hypothetical protein
VIVGCLLVIGLAPLTALLAGGILPDAVEALMWVVPQYVFPGNSLRLPDLPAGIEPAPGFRYWLGGGPVLLVWLMTVLGFGWFARGLKMWQICVAAVIVIAIITFLGHLVMRQFGFQLKLEFV